MGLRIAVRLPVVVYALAAATFIMGTSEFMAAGLLVQISSEFDIGTGHAGQVVTVFALGMIVGAPTTVLATRRLPPRTTLCLALVLFGVAHVLAALAPDFFTLLSARFIAAVATGAFWSVAGVVAARSVSPRTLSRALGVVLGGGMLANVVGVPLGAGVGQLFDWRTRSGRLPPCRSSSWPGSYDSCPTCTL